MRELGSNLQKHLVDLLKTYPVLAQIQNEIIEGFTILANCFSENSKLLIAGNGGSAADADHIVGELMKSFQLPRPIDEEFARKLSEADESRGSYLSKKVQQALPAISLSAHAASLTAFINDVEADAMFAQQLFGYGKPGDVFLAISTSGNSRNIINAAIVTKAMGIQIIALTGAKGGELARLADLSVKAPAFEVYKIQELHQPIYHSWCLMLEENFFGEQ